MYASFAVWTKLFQRVVREAKPINHRTVGHLRDFTFDSPLCIALRPVQGELGELCQRKRTRQDPKERGDHSREPRIIMKLRIAGELLTKLS